MAQFKEGYGFGPLLVTSEDQLIKTLTDFAVGKNEGERKRLTATVEWPPLSLPEKRTAIEMTE